MLNKTNIGQARKKQECARLVARNLETLVLWSLITFYRILKTRKKEMLCCGRWAWRIPLFAF
ncbi:hypothetical protein HHE03_11190 [Helicobacter heilmannii]|uniref:Uncharacterized protein n=1 Tax=Helicobacter heilmannii TaxID=35817 RepID=A0A0K2XTR8_HELHE|nr:hypothetical protein BN341_7660 [Helicobacter heilmannii ASB1.4]CRF49502.1 hypothetical protein HHE03_11190 [Helicobacter heilmannii]CRI34470.1 hypothetical protein HHE01_13160 [Helicobacter heilmannii]